MRVAITGRKRWDVANDTRITRHHLAGREIQGNESTSTCYVIIGLFLVFGAEHLRGRFMKVPRYRLELGICELDCGMSDAAGRRFDVFGVTPRVIRKAVLPLPNFNVPRLSMGFKRVEVPNRRTTSPSAGEAVTGKNGKGTFAGSRSHGMGRFALVPMERLDAMFVGIENELARIVDDVVVYEVT